jgi:excisionase family DNA binding protein
MGGMVVLDGEEYLTVEEAARILDVKPATLYAYVSRGILRSYRQGIKRQRLYRRAEVEGLLRLAPSDDADEPAGTMPRDALETERRVPEIPLAESWIRE